MAKKGSKLYTNGIEERYFFSDDNIPEGFTPCKIIYINDGENNKRWIEGKD